MTRDEAIKWLKENSRTFEKTGKECQEFMIQEEIKYFSGKYTNGRIPKGYPEIPIEEIED
jgi:hypothetical protein